MQLGIGKMELLAVLYVRADALMTWMADKD